jgi:hypothetical protein
MRKVIILISVLAAPVTCHAQDQLDLSRPADRPFQCGAVFAIVEQTYLDAGNAVGAAKFRAMFQRLAPLAETEFARQGRTKQDAQRYMQERVDGLVVLQGKEPRLVADFVRRCEARFSN